MSQYKEELWSNNYTVIPGFLDSCSAKELSDEFREFADRENLQGDSQVPNHHSLYITIFHSWRSYVKSAPK